MHVPATDRKHSKDLVVIASADRVLNEPNETLSRILAYSSAIPVACTDCETIDVIIADAGVCVRDLPHVRTNVWHIVYAYDTDRVIVPESNSPPYTLLPLATVWRHAREAGVAPVFDIPFVDATHEILRIANKALCDSDALPYTVREQTFGRVYMDLPYQIIHRTEH